MLHTIATNTIPWLPQEPLEPCRVLIPLYKLNHAVLLKLDHEFQQALQLQYRPWGSILLLPIIL